MTSAAVPTESTRVGPGSDRRASTDHRAPSGANAPHRSSASIKVSTDWVMPMFRVWIDTIRIHVVTVTMRVRKPAIRAIALAAARTKTNVAQPVLPPRKAGE